jgi:hypothetical protein
VNPNNKNTKREKGTCMLLYVERLFTYYDDNGLLELSSFG